MHRGNIVDEVLFVTDMEAAFAAVKIRLKVFRGRPLVTSTIGQIQRLALPELMSRRQLNDSKSADARQASNQWGDHTQQRFFCRWRSWLFVVRLARSNIMRRPAT